MAAPWARKGVKVVCIDPKWRSSDESTTDFPSIGEIYTITDAYNGGRFIGLEELNHDNIYTTYSFRPLVRETDDIALFKSLLNPTLVDKLDLLAERLDHIYNE